MDFRKVFLKARWERGVAGYMTGWGWGMGLCHRGYITSPYAPAGLGATCSWSSYNESLPFDDGFNLCKTTQECASALIWVFQRGAKAENMGRGVSQEGPVGSFFVAKPTSFWYFVITALGNEYWQKQVLLARCIFTAPSTVPDSCSVAKSSPVWLLVTPWSATHQASLSFTIS